MIYTDTQTDRQIDRHTYRDSQSNNSRVDVAVIDEVTNDLHRQTDSDRKAL